MALLSQSEEGRQVPSFLSAALLIRDLTLSSPLLALIPRPPLLPLPLPSPPPPPPPPLPSPPLPLPLPLPLSSPPLPSPPLPVSEPTCEEAVDRFWSIQPLVLVPVPVPALQWWGQMLSELVARVERWKREWISGREGEGGREERRRSGRCTVVSE